MQNRRLVLVFLVIFPMVFGLILTPDVYSNISNRGNDTELQESINYQEYDYDTENAFTLSQDSAEGIVNPIQIKESGFQDTDSIKAQTDTGSNTAQNITIDEGDGWFANYTSVEVSNLKRLYGVNGTFEDGVEPWTNYTVDGGLNTQIPGYDDDGEYITCRNVGNYRKIASNHYWEHSYLSEVGFKQAVYNTKGELIFDLRFDFRYVTGPIDPEDNNGFSGYIGVFYQVNDDLGDMIPGQGWYYPMETNVYSRDAWITIQHTFTIPTPYSEFSFALGLYLAHDITLNNVTDYDDDGEIDGIEHAQNLTIYIDNVEFTGHTAPSCESVDLTFHAGAFSEAITGSGTASISNPSCWTADPLEIEIISNTTVLFTYTVTTLFHRYTNSTWTTNPSKYGAAYSVTSGQSPDLTFYKYIPSSSEYYNSTMDILYPSDWENTTIWDPLTTNITGNCDISPGRVHVPNSELSRSGWWKINLNSLNYAKNVSVQVYDQGLGEWSRNSLFRPTNDTRVQVEIGTAGVTPVGGDPVNISWFLPDDSVWGADSITSMSGGMADSSIWTFGSMNTTAGEWSIVVLWTNGTEIAFESVTFDLYHSASIDVTYPVIETNYGLTISNLITFKDADTGEYLLDDSVSIVANWSSTFVTFTQNYAKNWWEADFDTALLGNGRFIVDVNASMPYFDTVTSQFTVISILETSLEILNAGSVPIENGFNEIFTVLLSYELLNGTGVAGAVPTITHSGQENSLTWSNFVDNNNGFYSIDIRCNTSGIYEVVITLSKPFHYNASDSFTLIINIIDTTVQGSSPFEALLVGRSYNFTFSYIFESNSSFIHGATVFAFGDGADWVTYTELQSGQYTVRLTPLELGEHYIELTFEKDGFETASYRLTFSVEKVPIAIEVLQGLSAPELSQSTILVRISEMDTHNIVSELEVFCYIIDPNGASGSSIVMTETSTSGVYSALIVMPAAEGDYHLQISCEAENYVLESSFTFQLQPGRDIMTMLWIATTRYYPFMLILAAIGLGLVYRRSTRKRRIRENKAALAVKRRFDDVKSLLGVIVLHKDSGLPVYSKILRDGLEETVISAFITAITSFRGEFDIESSSEEWGLIPISDIVRVISTNKLVCAFITTGNPSPEQRERMIQFAKAVGFIFDETMSDVPIVVLDQRTRMQFDTLFDDILDGSLLRTYKLDNEKKMPTNTCANERIARKQGVEFKLEELASELAGCGLEEGRVYKAIMTALESHFLVTTDESPFASEIIRAPETIPDEA